MKKLLKLLKIESPVGVLVSLLHESVHAQLSEEERGDDDEDEDDGDEEEVELVGIEEEE